ncbi:hypothetical protein AAC387_Pa10g0346 [Persea americana]
MIMKAMKLKQLDAQPFTVSADQIAKARQLLKDEVSKSSSAIVQQVVSPPNAIAMAEVASGGQESSFTSVPTGAFALQDDSYVRK